MIVLGVGGTAHAGKDTFVNIAKSILVRNNYTPMRMAFADKVKDEIQEMLRDNNFNLDAYTRDEKERIRPLFVFWATQRRKESPGEMYWINEVNKSLQLTANNYERDGASTDRLVVLLSDLRYINELKWVRDDCNGYTIHLKRFKRTINNIKEYDTPPNEEERRNDPLLIAEVDINIEWENKGFKSTEEAAQEPMLQELVLKTLNTIPIFSGKLI